MSRPLNYWTVLGLEEPPKDRKSLKRAYAKKLKVTRPEDDPEGFMLLRDAHDVGLREIAYQQSLETEVEFDTEPEAAPSQPESPDAEVENKNIELLDFVEVTSDLTRNESEELPANRPAPVPVESDLDDVYDSDVHYDDNAEFEAPKFPLEDNLVTLLDDNRLRYERDSWAEIFRQANALDIDDFSDFENGLLHLLLQKSGYYDNPYSDNVGQPITSQSIAASIFATLKWDEALMSHSYKSEGIAWLKQRLVKPSYKPTDEDGVHVPDTPNNFWTANLWWVVGLAILGIQLVRFFTNQ